MNPGSSERYALAGHGLVPAARAAALPRAAWLPAGARTAVATLLPRVVVGELPMRPWVPPQDLTPQEHEASPAADRRSATPVAALAGLAAAPEVWDDGAEPAERTPRRDPAREDAPDSTAAPGPASPASMPAPLQPGAVAAQRMQAQAPQARAPAPVAHAAPALPAASPRMHEPPMAAAAEVSVVAREHAVPRHIGTGLNEVSPARNSPAPQRAQAQPGLPPTRPADSAATEAAEPRAAAATTFVVPQAPVEAVLSAPATVPKARPAPAAEAALLPLPARTAVPPPALQPAPAQIDLSALLAPPSPPARTVHIDRLEVVSAAPALPPAAPPPTRTLTAPAARSPAAVAPRGFRNPWAGYHGRRD